MIEAKHLKYSLGLEARIFSNIAHQFVYLCVAPPEAAAVCGCVCVQVRRLPVGLCALWSFLSHTFVIPLQKAQASFPHTQTHSVHKKAGASFISLLPAHQQYNLSSLILYISSPPPHPTCFPSLPHSLKTTSPCLLQRHHLKSQYTAIVFLPHSFGSLVLAFFHSAASTPLTSTTTGAPPSISSFHLLCSFGFFFVSSACSSPSVEKSICRYQYCICPLFVRKCNSCEAHLVTQRDMSVSHNFNTKIIKIPN